MEKVWSDVLGLIHQGGINQVMLRYVNATGALVEGRTVIDKLKQESLNIGIRLDSGDLVYPNPTTAILNPFLDKPVISFICDLEKRPYDPVVAADLAAARVPSIFPVTVAGRPAIDAEIQALQASNPLPPVACSAISSVHAAGPADDNAEHAYDDIRRQAKERSYRGTSCHQCKNARSLDHLAFCSNLFNRRSRQDKRHCRKKYCDGCLSKCYGDSIANSKRQGWICPSCSGICRCAACTRIRAKIKTELGGPFHPNRHEAFSADLAGTIACSTDDLALEVLESGGGPVGESSPAFGKLGKSRRVDPRASPFPSTPTSPGNDDDNDEEDESSGKVKDYRSFLIDDGNGGIAA